MPRVSLRRKLSRSIRAWLRERHWRREYKRLEALRGLGEGRRAFLIGNGPSLARMDLSPLADEFVCVVNMGVRGIGTLVPRADMHVVMDVNRYRRFAREIEDLCERHAVPYRFLNLRMRRRWRLERRGARPFFCIVNPEKFAINQPAPDLAGGLVTGNVVLSAGMLLDHMGFSEIYLLGCDLDYSTSGEYFYAMGEADLTHEKDPDVRARRSGVDLAPQQFAAFRAHVEKRGRSIFNAGEGGKLECIPRVSFKSIFDAKRPAAAPPPRAAPAPG